MKIKNGRVVYCAIVELLLLDPCSMATLSLFSVDENQWKCCSCLEGHVQFAVNVITVPVETVLG